MNRFNFVIIIQANRLMDPGIDPHANRFIKLRVRSFNGSHVASQRRMHALPNQSTSSCATRTRIRVSRSPASHLRCESHILLLLNWINWNCSDKFCLGNNSNCTHFLWPSRHQPGPGRLPSLSIYFSFFVLAISIRSRARARVSSL